MGKPTGFMDYERQDKPAESPLERIKHFNEFHTPLSKEEQELQGARCMACGVPFCQSPFLESKVCECLVGLGHAVHLLRYLPIYHFPKKPA